MKELLDFAVEAARAAGEATLRYFGSESLDVETKADGTPVTRADREAEELLRARIGARHPEDGILGEEFGEQPAKSDRVWIIDPIDGTQSFAHGVPLYANLLALEVLGEAVLGVVCLPALREIVYAARGEGAWWITGLGGAEKRRPARVSAVDRLDEALLCTTSHRGFDRAGRRDLWERLLERVRMTRGWGDAYGHMLVATGRAELMVDPTVAVWDCAPLQPILEEAGGSFLDLAGNATHRGGSGVSMNGALRDEVARLLSGR